MQAADAARVSRPTPDFARQCHHDGEGVVGFEFLGKCIRTDYHWVKECVQLGDICPRRVSTENNISDI
eukprot:COSAG04_NODE_3239_length_3016_cov_33.006171_1_plen_67_part_10